MVCSFILRAMIVLDGGNSMPELPEVETIRRGLVKACLGHRVKRATLHLDRLFEGGFFRRFQRKVRGQHLIDTHRSGKYIILEFSGELFLIIHLGMSGRLFFTDPRDRRRAGSQKAFPLDKHVHFTLDFGDRTRLVFRDPRTFGRLIYPESPWQRHPRIHRLGVDPLSISRFLPFYKKHWPKKSRRSVKALLLDQGFLAGLGNIYADEALFQGGIHPATLAYRISRQEAVQLLRGIKMVLKRGLENRGTTFSDYRQLRGEKGGNQNHLRVYGRRGKPCIRCGGILVKEIIAQRGTTFCPHCQPHG